MKEVGVKVPNDSRRDEGACQKKLRIYFTCKKEVL